MNIREELLKEHSKTQALKIANYACSSPKYFKELMNCFIDDEYRLAQRAAWSVSRASLKQPELVQPYIKTLVAQLNRKDVHNAVVRSSLRVLQNINIPEKFHGEVMNSCFNFVEQPATPVAVKSFALKTLSNLAIIYPEIKNELRIMIEERWDTETAAFKAKGKHILKQLTKDNTIYTF